MAQFVNILCTENSTKDIDNWGFWNSNAHMTLNSHKSPLQNAHQVLIFSGIDPKFKFIKRQ